MVSLKDIAKNCGVSVATVSKALNGHSDISAATKKKICETAQKLGYMPNSAAKTLKTQKSNNIGVVFADGARSGLTHNYFNIVLEGVRQMAESKGYDITFIGRNGGSYYEKCCARGVDGVVIAVVDFEDPQVRELANSPIPVVTIDHLYNNCTAILSDNIQGMRDVVNYAISMGHKKIAYVHGQPSAVTQDRMGSFYKSLYDNNIRIPETYVVESDYLNLKSAADATRKLLGLRDRPTCILYPDDYSAIGGMRAIQDAGYSVPGDISVIGYDGQQVAEVITPKLTTFKQKTKMLGQLAAEKVIYAIEQPKTAVIERIVVEGELEKGASVKNIFLE